MGCQLFATKQVSKVQKCGVLFQSVEVKMREFFALKVHNIELGLSFEFLKRNVELIFIIRPNIRDGTNKTESTRWNDK